MSKITKKHLEDIGFSHSNLMKDILNMNAYRGKKVYGMKIPHSHISYIYAYLDNFNTFFFGDIRDAQFFTIRIDSVEQLKDFVKSLDFNNYEKDNENI